jgi:hypothetical protein
MGGVGDSYKNDEGQPMKCFCRGSRESLCAFLLFASVVPAHAAMQRLQLADSQKITNVWSGHPVDFAFVARGDSQYIAYYDTARRMTVTVRNIQTKATHTVYLPSTIGWDSHNYIALALDSLGYVHVSGNMHVNPLVYFRSTVPFKIDSLKTAAMVGTKEDSVTYPVFIIGPSDQLIYFYRQGSSGNGNQIFNKWTMSTKTWSRLFATPLFDGQGIRNAYMGGPIVGPDNYYHVYWMWRETPDAGTTHDVCYIRSKDLVNWETVTGTKLTLPITASTPGVRVDSIPQNSGLINRGAIGFDSQGRLILTYHKYDATANHYTQLYNARWEGTQWKIYQTSSWAYQWVISGTGSLVLQLTFGPVVLNANGLLTQSYYHWVYGTGVWQLNETTMHPDTNLGSSLWPVSLEAARNSGMDVHWLKSYGPITCAGTFFNSTSSPDPDPSTVYALRWETMPANNDQPRTPIPAPTALMLYKFRDPNATTAVRPSSPAERVETDMIRVQVSQGKIRILPVLQPGMRLTVARLQTRLQTRLQIFDMNGRIIGSYLISGNDASPIMVNTTGVSSGVYLIRLCVGNHLYQKPVFLSR